MQPNLAFTSWSIPLGTWLGVRVRVNIWYPLVLLLLLNWYGLELGFACFAILFVITLLHEFAHVAAARLTGGEAADILLWPLGGLAFCRPAPTLASQFLTAAAGPISNALICLAALPAVLQARVLQDALNPTILPVGGLAPDPVQSVLVLIFSLSWFLLLINLIPAFPLDGGQMLNAILAQRMGSGEALALSLRIGWVVGAIGAFLGVLVDNTTAVFLSFFVLVMNIQELLRMQFLEIYGEGSEGQEFAAGYSAFSDSDAELPAVRQSFWQRWKENRAAARFERQQEQRAATARRVDDLLDKVHRSGMDSLTVEERRFLADASNQYRTHHDGKEA